MATTTLNVPERGSAKVLLRLPHGLRERLKQVAAEEGVSTNTLIATLLAGAVGWSLGPEPRRSRPSALR
jgi:predicted HicB family RNase H-like nuclease